MKFSKSFFSIQLSALFVLVVLSTLLTPLISLIPAKAQTYPIFNLSVDCVEENTDGTYTAYFGYRNNEYYDIDLRSSLTTTDKFGPAILRQGNIDKAFSVSDSIENDITWTVNYEGIFERSATASIESERCEKDLGPGYNPAPAEEINQKLEVESQKEKEQISVIDQVVPDENEEPVTSHLETEQKIEDNNSPLRGDAGSPVEGVILNESSESNINESIDISLIINDGDVFAISDLVKLNSNSTYNLVESRLFHCDDIIPCDYGENGWPASHDASASGWTSWTAYQSERLDYVINGSTSGEKEICIQGRMLNGDLSQVACDTIILDTELQADQF
ncbi:MAG: hypothetical protein Q9M91_02930 [Candidatus Dojkabacteria bacterium]|nr:hypothetical protein [Candidatus Dojkabacteria bacterium]